MKALTFCLRWLVIPLIPALLLPAISGCITPTPSQTFALSSTPSGARVTVNGTLRGFTPVSMSLPWKQEYHVALGLDGYEPYSFGIKPQMGSTAWVIHEFLIGGLVGYTLDAATGVFTPLKTEQPHTGKGTINVQLKPVPKRTE
ncbi:MAG: PEGA domain-containing protein [Verrucomicrobiota bacterium]